MLTTDRTTIRRRLTVGRRANRPPRRLWKPGHRAIVAPLGATLAATLALGVGVALARAGRERLIARRPPPRELDLLGGEPLHEGFKRMALEQLDLAIEQLGGGAAGTPREKAVHETRKALKRLRAMFRLLEPSVGKDAFAREAASLRSAARHLGGARDAEVMLATLDALIARHPRKLARSKGVRRLRAQLAAEHARMHERTLGDAATLALVLGELHSCRLRVLAWQLPAGAGLELAEPGLRRLYAQGRVRFRRAASDRGERTLAMHEWRKRVKDLRYAAEMLRRGERPRSAPMPSLAGVPLRADSTDSRRKRRAERKDARLFRELARRADELGEVLGEDHDLAVLAAAVRRPAKHGLARVKLARRARKRLLKAIARRRHALRRRALREGELIYAPSPKRFMARVSAAGRETLS